MTVYVASDHRGYRLKAHVVAYLRDTGHEVEDVGDSILDPDDDFPVFAARGVHKVLENDGRAILICGSGQGMAIAANRFRGIRAVLGWSVTAAKEARNDEDSNVLALPAEIMHKKSDWQSVVDAWLSTPFANEARYKRRLRQLDELI